jgi:hypothetical protein
VSTESGHVSLMSSTATGPLVVSSVLYVCWPQDIPEFGGDPALWTRLLACHRALGDIQVCCDRCAESCAPLIGVQVREGQRSLGVYDWCPEKTVHLP